MGPIQATSVAPSSLAQRSPWHSPVPYLFGGLAAMLGLIAFALLILACSYWKLSGYLEGGERQEGERDLESGEATGDSNGELKQRQQPTPAAFEPKFVVVMAGQEKPTFLATPISSRALSVSSTNSNCSCSSETTVSSEEEVAAGGIVKMAGGGDQVQIRNIDNHAPADQGP